MYVLLKHFQISIIIYKNYLSIKISIVTYGNNELVKINLEKS
jgi:hypothetical protein